MVRQAKDIPAAVTWRGLQQLHIEPLQHIAVLKLRVGGANGSLQHAREVVEEELACRPLELIPRQDRQNNQEEKKATE